MKCRTSLGVLIATCGAAFGQVPDHVEKDCDPLPGWETIAELSKGGVAIFGETHGTRQSPAAVAEFVCAVSDRPVLLAVELDAKLDDELQSVWDDTSSEAITALAPVLFRGRSDGVGSEAMLKMLIRLHQLKRSGADIDVVAFNGPRDSAQVSKFADLHGQGPHEAMQAENIDIAMRQGDYDHAVVLVGSFHAQKTVVQMGDVSFEPMAMQLSRMRPVFSLKMAQAGGSAWQCQLKKGAHIVGATISEDQIECGDFDIDPEADDSPGIQVNEGDIKRYDGVYNVGAVQASPPAS